jgi:chorismate synthase
MTGKKFTIPSLLKKFRRIRMIRYFTAGESHGKSLIGIIEGMVAGLEIKEERIEEELKLRRIPLGRSRRMEIEKEEFEILSGIRNGKTTGAPIAIRIFNKDVKEMVDFVPRPGHADLAGCLKYNFKNIHLIAERASARETAIRVAIGAICKIFLSHFGIDFVSHTVKIGDIECKKDYEFDFIKRNRLLSPIFCVEKERENLMVKIIKEAESRGDTVGGESEIIVRGLPPGIGSHVHYDRRLDFKIGGALFSIPGVKGVEIGKILPFGSLNNDPIYFEDGRIKRRSNNSGGIEGGISNGENILVRIKVKPPPTLRMEICSVNLIDKRNSIPSKLRGDTCVVPSAGIVAENVLAIEIANLFLEKFGGDSIEETTKNWISYMESIK